MTCAFVLMALVYLDVVRIWHVLALSFISGTAQAFGGPAYQSLIPQLVLEGAPAERHRAELDPVQPGARRSDRSSPALALAALGIGGLLRPQRRCRSSS